MITHWCSLDWEKVVRVFSALLTPLIAGAVAYIAWQQHKTNRNQFRLALLERRLKVFNGVAELMATIMRKAKIDPDGLQKFLWETRERGFLFGPDISAYLDELYEKAADIQAFEGLAVEEELRKRRTEALLWFSRQGDQLKQKFGKYMAFKEPD